MNTPSPANEELAEHNVLSTARRLDSHRVDCRDGGALLSSFFALPDADGLGVDFGRHRVSAASNARAQNARQAGSGGHCGGATGYSRDRHPHRAADEFARRFRAWSHRRRAEQHAGDSSATRKRERVAGGRRTRLRHLVGCAHEPAGTRAELATEDWQSGTSCTGNRREHWRRTAAIPGLVHRRRDRDGVWRIGRRCHSCDLRAYCRRETR